jgi:hypothetical protein
LPWGSLAAAVPAIAGGVLAESAKASTTDLLVTGLEVATVTGTSVIITWFTGSTTEADTYGFPPGPTRALLNYPENASSRCSSKSVPYTAPMRKSIDGRGTSAFGPDYRREVSSITISAADCGCLASATPCPARIESASISPVVPAIGGAGS